MELVFLSWMRTLEFWVELLVPFQDSIPYIDIEVMNMSEEIEHGQIGVMALMSGPGSQALMDSIIVAFAYFTFLSQLVSFTTIRARFASLKFACPEDKIVIKASRKYEPVGENGQALVEVQVKDNATDKLGSPKKEGEKEREDRRTGESSKPVEKQAGIQKSAPKDVTAFVRVMETCMLIIPNPFPTLIERDVDRWERIHRHLTENNVSFGMLVLALYFAIIRCQILNPVDEFGVFPLCEELSLKGAATIYSYVSSRALHFVVYSYAIRQPYRLIAYMTSQLHLCFILFLIWKAVH